MTYWYRVIAETSDGVVQSNPASAETPTLNLSVRGIAVSTRDQHLHVFGLLSNGFPQVIRISPDGSVVERRNGVLIPFELRENPFYRYIDEFWLRDDGGLGVLRFRGTPGQVPAELFSAVRVGDELLRDYLLRPEQGLFRFAL